MIKGESAPVRHVRGAEEEAEEEVEKSEVGKARAAGARVARRSVVKRESIDENLMHLSCTASLRRSSPAIYWGTGRNR